MANDPNRAPRVGGIIEDETGYWIVDFVDTVLEEVRLLGPHGVTQWRGFAHLGLVKYQ